MKPTLQRDGDRWFLSYPQPDRLVSSNHREHWAKLQSTKKAWRDTATLAAVDTRFELDPDVRWDVTMRLPVAKLMRRDPANWVGTIVKWTVDGLVAGGVWRDDDSKHVRVLEPVFRLFGADEVPFVQIRFER